MTNQELPSEQGDTDEVGKAQEVTSGGETVAAEGAVPTADPQQLADDDLEHLFLDSLARQRPSRPLRDFFPLVPPTSSVAAFARQLGPVLPGAVAFAPWAQTLNALPPRVVAFPQLAAASAIGAGWNLPLMKPMYAGSEMAQIFAAYKNTSSVLAGIQQLTAGFAPYITPSWQFALPETGWTRLAGIAGFTAELRSRLADLLHGLHDRVDTAQADPQEQDLYHQALKVRHAVLTELDSKRVVRWFARTMLGIADVTEYVVEAVVDVLLTDDWHDTAMTNEELREHLDRKVDAQHKVTKPIWELRPHRQRIGTLSWPVTTADGVVTTLDQVLPDPRGVEQDVQDRLGGYDDPRLTWLISKLDPAGRDIIQVKAGHHRLPWADAALAAGHPEERGEAVRRRIDYLRRDLARRQPHLSAGAPQQIRWSR